MPIERVTRMFQAPTATSGYQFIYLPQKGRISMGETRRSLSSLGINNSRILDIQTPSRNIRGLLVHNDFISELLEKLEAEGVSPLDNFDPTDAATIREPKLLPKSPEEKTAIAKEVYRTRLLRIADRARPHVRQSLAQNFIATGVFSYEEWCNYQPGSSTSAPPAPTTTRKNHTFFTDDGQQFSHNTTTSNSDSMELQ